MQSAMSDLLHNTAEIPHYEVWQCLEQSLCDLKVWKYFQDQ